MIPLNFDGIPAELKECPNWVLWQLEEREGHKTKIPYQIDGTRAVTTNPRTWYDFNSVQQASSEYSGIGYVFTESTGIVGIDWDHVRTETGEWNQEALEEIKSCASYAELSQSGSGAHVLIKGKIPGVRKRKDNFEIYSKDRFFVVTGSHIPGTPEEIKENQEAINKLYKKHFEGMVALTKSDETILQECSTDKKFVKLFAGDTSDYDNDESRADLALCGILAKHTQDKGQINRLFCRSGLFRQKWERADYKNGTIDKALQGDVYKGEKPKKIDVPFDVVGDYVLHFFHVFSMQDNGEIYLYKDGVYRSEGTVSILGTKIRELYKVCFALKCMNLNISVDRIPAVNTRYVNEVLEYIRAYTHVKREDIDQDRYINFKNGLFDLQEWRLIEHTPEIKSITQLPILYDPNATCPAITKFFQDCELPDKSIKVLEEFAGYCLTSDVRIQKALMLFGNGSNGKSVFINLLKKILGADYVSGESLHDLETDKYRVANLYSKRLNAFPDLKDSPLQTNEVFNILTGNDLELIGERKYQHAFSFKPTAKLLFSANKLPFAFSDNYAFYRRWLLIEFPKTFSKGEINKSLLKDLTTEKEMSGFINLMLEGLKRVMVKWEFSSDPGVDEIQKMYLMHSDNVLVFNELYLRECVGDEEPTEKRIVYHGYCEWCKEHNIKAVTNTKFTQRLGKLGRRIRETTRIVFSNYRWYVCYMDTVFDRSKDL